MLFKKTELEAIRNGEIRLAFRCWQRSSVKGGSTLKTGIGLLAIDAVEVVDPKKITEKEAREAGKEDLRSLLETLNQGRGKTAYRIRFHYAGEDPRISLRNKTSLGNEEWEQIEKKLDRLDTFSRNGPWVRVVLKAIEANPRLAAVEIASITGFEKEWLKTNIRKLKNLGLTVSHQPGYEISPRGKVVLSKLVRDGSSG